MGKQSPDLSRGWLRDSAKTSPRRRAKSCVPSEISLKQPLWPRHNDAERATKARFLVREPREGRAKSTRRRNRREVSSRSARARVGASVKAPRASIASRSARSEPAMASGSMRRGGQGPGSPRPARPSRVARWRATAAVTVLAVLAAVTVRTRDARRTTRVPTTTRRSAVCFLGRHACPPPPLVPRPFHRARARAHSSRITVAEPARSVAPRVSADRSCPLPPRGRIARHLSIEPTTASALRRRDDARARSNRRAPTRER